MYTNAAVSRCISGLYLPGIVSVMSFGEQDAGCGLFSLQTLTRMMISVVPHAVTFSSARLVFFVYFPHSLNLWQNKEKITS